ncbi:hypothetical protein L218DRAFT_958416 [Marasmius fiardii PR-910]|nr:hypothetical protein L218DRAFT_958416 [Marasmius fiardii PR-910]
MPSTSFSNFQLHAPQAHTPQTILLKSLAQGKAFHWQCCSRRLVCGVICCGLSTGELPCIHIDLSPF